MVEKESVVIFLQKRIIEKIVKDKKNILKKIQKKEKKMRYDQEIIGITMKKQNNK